VRCPVCGQPATTATNIEAISFPADGPAQVPAPMRIDPCGCAATFVVGIDLPPITGMTVRLGGPDEDPAAP
jgi:hypothetical protein